MKAIAATEAFRRGDPDTVAAYYRIHFKPALARPEDLERVMASFRATFTSEGILGWRAIEDHLMKETWSSESYDLLPSLAKVTVPTLVITGITTSSRSRWPRRFCGRFPPPTGHPEGLRTLHLSRVSGRGSPADRRFLGGKAKTKPPAQQ